MRRIVPLLLVALIVSVSVCSADANSSKSVKKIGVIIIGGDEFKKEKFFAAAEDIAPKEKNYLVKVGDEIQTLWSDFCAEKNISPDEPPKTDEVTTFVAQNNFHRVLALVIQNVHSNEYVKEARFNKQLQELHCELRLHTNGYMFDTSGLIKALSSMKKRDSAQSLTSMEPELRARLGAFRLCVNEIGKNLKDSW